MSGFEVFPGRRYACPGVGCSERFDTKRGLAGHRTRYCEATEESVPATSDSYPAERDDD